MKNVMLAAGLVVVSLLAAACGDSDETAATTGDEAGAISVAAAFYPIEEAVRTVGGERVEVTNLVPPGGTAHDLELSGQAAAAIETADLVLYLGEGFQTSVESAVANRDDADSAIDLLDGIDLRGADAPVPGVVGEVDGTLIAGGVKDPHFWVDPALFGSMVETVRDALAAADPEGEPTYTANAEAYLAEVDALDADFAAGLEACRGRALVTSHAAFGYLADRYGLIQAPIAGISPEEEPDPKSLAATAAFAREKGVTTVFFETLVPKDLAETVAAEIGAKTDALDPVEGIAQDQLDEGATYLTIQRDNLQRLESGLGCTEG
jgi:zinc transport system substrate-binding protein